MYEIIGLIALPCTHHIIIKAATVYTSLVTYLRRVTILTFLKIVL